MQTIHDGKLKNVPLKYPNGSICHHHKNKYLEYFSRNFTKCCDPYKRHLKTVKEKLTIIDLRLVGNCLKNNSINLIPGDKLCLSCLHLIKDRSEAGGGTYDTNVRNFIENKNQ